MMDGEERREGEELRQKGKSRKKEQRQDNYNATVSMQFFSFHLE